MNDGLWLSLGSEGTDELLWGNNEFRGCGMVVDCLRDRWYYAALVALHAQPMSPSQLLGLFRSAHDANVPVFGTHSIYQELVTRHLGSLTRAGLIEPAPRDGRRRPYRASPLGAELLESLADSAGFGLAHYEWLAMCTRIQRHLDTDAPIPGPDPRDSPAMVEERLRRRSVVMLFGELLAPKWTFSVMAALAGGSLRFSEIIEVVNVAVEASSDVVSGHLADSGLAGRLEALQALTLVDRKREFGRARCYALTRLGHELVASLEPVALFGRRRDAELTAAVLAM